MGNFDCIDDIIKFGFKIEFLTAVQIISILFWAVPSGSIRLVYTYNFGILSNKEKEKKFCKRK